MQYLKYNINSAYFSQIKSGVISPRWGLLTISSTKEYKYCVIDYGSMAKREKKIMPLGSVTP